MKHPCFHYLSLFWMIVSKRSGDPEMSCNPEMRCDPELLGSPCLVCDPCDLEPGWDPEKNFYDQGSMRDPYLLLGYFGMNEIYWFGVWFGEMSGIDELSWISESSWFEENSWFSEIL